MNRPGIAGVGSTTPQDKDLFINQAKEARQARELARRKDEAATTIQSCIRGYMVRKKSRTEVCRRLNSLTQATGEPKLDELFSVIKHLLLFCDYNKDKDLFQAVFQLIINIQTKSTSNPTENEHPSLTGHDGNQIDLLRRILNLCIYYLVTADKSTKINSVQLNVDLQLINSLSSSIGIQWDRVQYVIKKPNASKQELKQHDKRFTFMKCITDIISENVNSLRADLRPLILNNYVELLLKLLLCDIRSSEHLQKLSETESKSVAEVLISLFSIPGIIYFIQKYSPKALETLSQTCKLDIYIRVLGTRTLDTSSNCLVVLSNFIQLVQNNQDGFVKEKSSSINLIISLLKSCQNDLAQKQSANRLSGVYPPEVMLNSKKKNEAVNVTFHPLLGWLSEKQPIVMDRDIIKSQLSYLWSSSMIKLIFGEFLDTSGMNKKSNLNATPEKHRFSCSSKKTNQNQRSPDSSPTITNTSANILRRAVERVSLSIPKSVTSTYSKLGTFSNSGVDKLATRETQHLSQACSLFNTAIQTLTIIKQDIIGSLCLHETLIIDLWKFISSLGPQDGLVATLEHLVKTGNSSAPEFNILMLFCECASHLINILDDSELYEKQRPFGIRDLVSIANFMNNLVFRCICDNHIVYSEQQVDPLIHATHKLLYDLYKRDCRRSFTTSNFWIIKDIRIPNFLKDLESGKPVARAILSLLPHSIPHKERVLIFRKLVAKDRAQYCNQVSTLITIHRSRIVEDGYQQLTRLQPHALKGLIRVKFINDHGLDEAGIDQDGVFKEFLEDTIKKVFDPQLNLFSTTSEQCLYPSPTSRLHENHLSLFKFVGKMIGKALYDGIVVDVPFALFFLSRVLGQPQSPLYSPIDELPSLDLELYKSLTYLKHYEGDVADLDLTFSIDQDFMGKIETYELEPGGRSIPVTRDNRVRYIHSVANFRMRKQIEKQTEAFVNGFRTIINLEWLSMFSASEFQRLISGDNTPIDLQDLRRNTTYYGGFHNNHRVVCWLWDILDKDFNAQEQSLFLKFVTSCSKPPLLGFSNLEPPFSVRCVEVGDDQDPGDTLGSVMRVLIGLRRSTDPVDRLPTSSTCFNLLKLPNYHRRNTLRDKLRYAIRSNPGFELS